MQNQRIAIFGGSSGIGRALAHQLATANEVHVISRTESDIGTHHAVDLADTDAIARVCTRLGAIDHLVFTAGGPLEIGPVKDLPLDNARRYFDVRFFGALAAAKHATVRHSITFTGGAAAHRPTAGWAMGASICAAMEGLTRALAIELAPVRVNIIVPGFVDTKLWSTFPADAMQATFAEAARKLPVQHVGTADEVAAAYAAIMSNTYITGQRLVVDGGHVLI